MTAAADLRRHADHCRFLADFMLSPHDKQKILQSAREFDHEALRAEQKADEAELDRAEG
jgi:hypothetical protein